MKIANVTALTSGIDIPSSRFRVRQYISELKRFNVHVQEISPRVDKYSDLPGILGSGVAKKYFPPLYYIWSLYRLANRIPGVIKSYKSNIVWLEREFQPGIPSFEIFLRGPVVFDVDDAIWLKPPAGKILSKLIARRSACIIAGNTYIADWFSKYNQNVYIVPTAVDVCRYRKGGGKRRSGRKQFVIGWTGLSDNFHYLYQIEAPLAQFLNTFSDSRLVIVADKPPRFKKIRKHIFFAWNRVSEIEALKTFDVGIMPLTDDEWSRGKCSFKMLQYMAAGLPVVVSPVGMNRDVMRQLEGKGIMPVSEVQWFEALSFLYNNPGIASAWGSYGSQIVEKHYSIPKIAARLAEIFHHLS
jgi:glycosyltransferase involved in cell wall biosynthesis